MSEDLTGRINGWRCDDCDNVADCLAWVAELLPDDKTSPLGINP